MKSKTSIVVLALVECFLLILLMLRGKTIPASLDMGLVFLSPFIALGLGIALLIVGGCTKSKVAAGSLRAIGAIAIILSLIFIAVCLMVARGLHSLM